MILSLFQDMTLPTTILTLLLPFLSFVSIMLFTRARPGLSAGLSIAAVSLSLISDLSLLVRHWHLETPLQYRTGSHSQT